MDNVPGFSNTSEEVFTSRTFVNKGKKGLLRDSWLTTLRSYLPLPLFTVGATRLCCVMVAYHQMATKTTLARTRRGRPVPTLV